MAELKPCAHCGGDAKFGATNCAHYVTCRNCGVSSVACRERGKAAQFWNTRPPLAEAGDRLAEAMEKARHILQYCPDKQVTAETIMSQALADWRKAKREV